MTSWKDASKREEEEEEERQEELVQEKCRTDRQAPRRRTAKTRNPHPIREILGE